MGTNDQDVVAEEPRESRTAQFYQARDEAAHPLKAKYTAEAKRAKYEIAQGHVGRDNPSPARLKVWLGGPSHTRVSAVVRRTTVADTQEE